MPDNKVYDNMRPSQYKRTMARMCFNQEGDLPEIACIPVKEEDLEVMFE